MFKKIFILIIIISIGFGSFFLFKKINKNQSKNIKQIDKVSKNISPITQKDTPLIFYDGFELGDRLSDGWNSFLVHTPTSDELKNCPDYPNGSMQKYILCSHAFDLVTSPVRSGKYAIKFTVNPGDTAVPGDAEKLKDRAELQRKEFGDEGKNGTEFWYGWSFLIPKDYKYDPVVDTLQIMGQLHVYDQGEATISPPASIEYGMKDGERFIYADYGLKNINKAHIAISPINLGEWIDIAIHIKWSNGSDGFIEVYKDGKAITPFNGKDYKVYGQNLPNSYSQSFFKIGLYRGHGVKTTNSVYYDEVKISKSRFF